MQFKDDKIRKTSGFKAHSKLLLIGVMVLLGVFFISFVSAYNYTSSTGVDPANGNPQTGMGGMTWKITNSSFGYIVNVTKSPNSSATIAYIKTSYGSANTTNATFVGNVATFSPRVNLTGNVTYFILVNADGASYGLTYIGGVTYPIASEGGSYISGINQVGGSDSSNAIVLTGITWDDETGVGTPTISVNLTSPANATIINTDGEDFAVNLSITGTNLSYEWVNNTYYIWFSNGTLANTTFVSGLSTNQTNFSRNIDNFIVGKSYLWNSYACYGNTTYSNCSWATNNYTFTYVPFTNTGESYSLATYETKNETFYLNITTISGATKMGAFLVYNGTFYAASHSCSGSNCQIWRKIDIPLMTTTASSENKSFYWQITIFGTFGTSTSTTTVHNQNVSNLVFNNCVPGYNNTVNFTIYNETNNALIVAGFKSTFNYWLGTGTVKDSYNFSGTGNNNYLFCINHNLSYITSSYITIKASSHSRIYQFVEEIYTNVLKVQKLFIPDNDYNNIIIEVKNQGLVPQKDISVNISRYYPETDTYEFVENQVTDEYGQIIAKLIQNDAKYKFNFYNSAGTLLKTSDLVTIICRSSICVIPFVIETTSDYLGRYDTLDLFDYELTFDNTTNIFSYSWDDQRGESSTHRLEVIKYAFNESTVVCNKTSTTTVSSLTCNVGSTPASYTAQTFRLVNGEVEIRTDYLQVIVGDYSATFGIEGLFWVFILLMTCVGIGVYDPKVGAILYGFGFILMGILKIIYMPLPVFFANTVICIIFIWAVKT